MKPLPSTLLGVHTWHDDVLQLSSDDGSSSPLENISSPISMVPSSSNREDETTSSPILPPPSRKSLRTNK